MSPGRTGLRARSLGSLTGIFLGLLALYRALPLHAHGRTLATAVHVALGAALLGAGIAALRRGGRRSGSTG